MKSSSQVFLQTLITPLIDIFCHMLYNIIIKILVSMCNQRRRIFWKNCVKTPLFSFFFEIIQTDSQFRLAAALLRMKSRLFDNGQTGERSRFPCVEDPNCAHGKHLHFKGLLLVCIMFDTGARSSQSQLVGTSISTTRGYYLHACVLSHTYT